MENELILKTIKELKEMALGLGVKDVESFTTKAQLISIISTLNAMTPGVAQPTTNEDIMRHNSKAERMKARLEAQPKVSFFLPLDPGEKLSKKPSHSVTLNGYTFTVPKGVMTQVPEQVAEVLGEYLTANATAGEEFKLDRDSKVKEALT